VSAFRVLGSLPANVWVSGTYNNEHNHEKTMLNTRINRLLETIRRIEGVRR